MKRALVPAAIVSVALGALTASDALATATNLTIHNHTDMKIACAVVRYQDNDWQTQHWFVLENGQTQNFPDAHYAYCEKLGGGGKIWPGSGPNFCVSGGGGFVNPIFRSGSSDRCREINGVMRPFLVLGGGSYTWYLE